MNCRLDGEAYEETLILHSRPMSPWPLSAPATQKKLERGFRNHSIDCVKPGFCDSESFLSAERLDPRFLETYAQFVEARAYDNAYLTEARRKIDLVAEVVRSAVAKDGRLGACVDASGMVGRMLDRLGVWNYVAKTTLTLSFGATGLGPEYFWVLDEGDFVASHAIVVAPPYGVIDITVKLQPYAPEKQVLLPELVLADHFERTSWTEGDLANPDIRTAVHRAGFRRFADYLTLYHPQMLEVMDTLPARLVRDEDLSLKYVIVAVGGFVEPLEKVLGYQPGGKTALQLFDDEVVPRL